MAIHKDTHIGHVHLTVADLEKSLTFYRDFLGFEVVARYGSSAVFLSAGGVSPAPAGYAGLYHFAILFPTRKELARIVKRLIDAHYPLEGASDHGVSEAIYLRDPDNIGVELYVDRPKKTWKRLKDGSIEMVTKALDINNLLDELK
jgi:catechol 2,3-dioxygenase